MKFLVYICVYIVLLFSISLSRRQPKFNDPRSPEAVLERERQRKIEKDLIDSKRKKVENSQINVPPGGESNFNKHREEDDGMDIVNKEKQMTKEQKEKQKKIQDDLRKTAEQMKKKTEQRENIKENKKKMREQRREEIQRKKAKLLEDDSNVELKAEIQREEDEYIKEEMEENEEQAKIQQEEDILKLEKLKLEAELNRDNTQDWLVEWEELMSDFQADEMLTFQVDRKQSENFFEEINEPCQIRGAYFLSFQNKRQSIDFHIISPKTQKKIFSKTDQQGIFSISIGENDEFGNYEFVFQNKNSQNAQVSFAIDVTGNEEFLQSQDINTLEDNVKEINVRLKDQHRRQQLSHMQSMSLYFSSKKMHKKIFGFTIAETLVIIACTIFQVHYIKKLLDNRNIV